MKKFSKLMLTLLAVLFFAAAIEVPSHAYYKSTYDTRLTQTYAAANGCTVTWNTPTIKKSNYTVTITGYYLSTGGYYLGSSSSSTTLVGQYDSSARNAWVNLAADTTGYVYLSCCYQYETKSYIYTVYQGLTYAAVNTVPSTPTTNFGIGYTTNDNKVEFQVNRPNTSYKSQVNLYQDYNFIGTINLNSSYSDYVACATNTVYRYCARYYYTNPDNGVTYTGNWSSCRAYDIPYISVKSKSNKKGFTAKVKKATSVAYYNLYVNDRFVKKLSTGKKASKTFTIKKGYTKKKYNTIKLVPVISGYGESDIAKTGSLYIKK